MSAGGLRNIICFLAAKERRRPEHTQIGLLRKRDGGPKLTMPGIIIAVTERVHPVGNTDRITFMSGLGPWSFLGRRSNIQASKTEGLTYFH